MGPPAKSMPSLDVSTIAQALPPPTRPRPRSRSQKPAQKPMPPTLPACFEPIWRRRLSTLPAHRRERATLEAVASTIPPELAALTAQPAAAAYLAALVLSLRRLVAVTAPSAPVQPAQEKPLSRKERKKLRREERLAEQAVQKMPAADAISAPRASMDLDEEAGSDTKDPDDAELIASLVYLIGLAAQGCSAAVLNAKCETILEAVMCAYDHVSGAGVVGRHSSSVFATVLAGVDASSWSKPVVQRAYLYLLRQTCDADSRARRKARDSLDALLKSPRGAAVCRRTSGAASAHFVAELRLQGGFLEEVLHGDSVMENKPNPVRFVYLLTSLEKFAVFLMPLDAAKVAKELVLIANKHLPHVSSFALLALSSIFKTTNKGNGESAEGKESVAFLPQGDLGKLLHAVLKLDLLEDSSPETVIAYSSCVSNGVIAYLMYFPFSSPAPEFIVTPVKKLCSALDPAGGRTDVSKNICANLKNLFAQRCFRGRPEIFVFLQAFTSTAYRLLWPDTTPVLKKYLEEKMPYGNLQMKEPLSGFIKTVVAARTKAISANDRKTQDMANGVILSLARGGGAEHLLNACGIQYDKKLHVTNAWILPILREGLCGSPLSLFTVKLAPVATNLMEVMTSPDLKMRPVECKNIGMTASQIWGLLPGFCNKPSDLGQNGVFTSAFKAIHFCLTSKGLSSMYSIGVGALRQLSMSMLSLNVEDPITVSRKQSFGGRLKKLFPTITTVTEGTPDDRRGLILNAVTVACRATDDPSLVAGLLRKSIRHLLELQLLRSKDRNADMDTSKDGEEQVVRNQHATADLAIAITESGIVPTDSAEVSFLEKAMSPFFLDRKEPSLQKKAYKATTLLIGLGSMTKEQDDLFKFAKNIADAHKSVASGSKAARLGLVTAIVNKHLKLNGAAEKSALLSLATDLFLSEAVLGTRDSSEKTRSAAFETLIAMARGWNSSSSGNETAGLQQFLMAVAAGLGGRSVAMLSASLTSLGRIIFDFQAEACSSLELSGIIDSLFASQVSAENDNVKMTSDEESAEQIVVQPGPISILLRHQAMEVQKSALGVVKIATRALSKPPERLTNILPGIIPGLVHAAARSKKHEVRLRVRVILERLLRKCGREALEANFPEDHMKLLAAVRKKYSRDLIKKHAAKEQRKENQGIRAGAEKALQEMEPSDESDGSGIDDSDSDIEREMLDGDEMIASQKKSGGKRDGQLQMKEKKEDVMDLLDSKNSHGVLTRGDVKEASRVARKEQNMKRFRGSDSVIKYTDDGKPIFVESDESGVAEVGSDLGEDSDSEADEMTGDRGSNLKKRGRRDVEESERHNKKMKGSFGEEYKSRKGKGDVKRPGRPDPYAYIPLGANMLSSKFSSGTNGKNGGRGTSLRRIAGSKGMKRKVRKTGVPGKR